MLELRTLRRLVFAILVALALTLLPATPAAAAPVDSWALHLNPAVWNFLGKVVEQLWGVKIGSNIDPDGSPLEIGSQTDPHGSPLEIGVNIDPHG